MNLIYQNLRDTLHRLSLRGESVVLFLIDRYTERYYKKYHEYD